MNNIQRKAFSEKFKRRRVLWSSIPHPSFPAISLTGNNCALDCDHCKGHYLEGMVSARNPEKLQRICLSLYSEGAKGVLLSGGYNSEGYVPFDPFLDVISRIKKKTDLFVSIHSGIVPEDLAKKLGKSGVDLVDFDLIADDSTISSRIGLDKTAEEYKRSLHSISEEIPYLSPHILLGLSGTSLESEKKALSFLEGVDMSALVFLVIIPPPDSNYKIPDPKKVGEFIARARLNFPDTPMALGCMRPKSSERIPVEIESIKSGIDRIVLPSQRAVEFAEWNGLVVKELEACCAVPEDFLVR